MLIAQFNVPVRKIDKVLPEVMLRRSKSDLDKRAPFWPLRFPDQAHVHFTRKPVALLCITCDARTNHVFPSCRPSAIARDDVIQIEVAPVKHLAAILAGVLVALENVVPGKLYFLFRQPIENQQYNHPRDTNLERNCRDHFVVRRVGRNIAPAIEIVRQEIVRFIG